jgi:DNA-3-methyladenine glycosylase
MLKKPFLRLDPTFFCRPVTTVARDLLGAVLVHERCIGQIVETEAYHESEAACHAWQGRRSMRNRSMFAEPGTIYIYRIHQVFCLNFSAEARDIGAAVLIRGLEPLAGLEEMRERRPKAKNTADLLSGPGKICQAFDLNLSHDGQSVCSPETKLYLLKGNTYPDTAICATPRIGISKAKDLPWRYWVKPSERVIP